MSKIELGKKWDDIGEPTSIDDLRKETHYPTLHLDDVEDKRLADMPDSGTMTVHYKIKNRTHSEREQKGKKCHSCSVTMDITHVDPPPGKGKKKDSDGGARKALSEYFKDK
jgi:hypothetical protein